MSELYAKINTNIVKIGDIEIGADRRIAVQSMTKTDTRDAAATAEQIRELALAGCDIVRMSVPDMAAAAAVGPIRRMAGEGGAPSVPLVADIHFDHRLALESIRQGIDKVRINPGNIGDRSRVKEVADAARERRVPIRIGVNGGSLDKELLGKYGGVTAEALVESAIMQADALNMCGFYDIVVSIKASDVFLTVEACRLFHSKNTGIPQHIGITEAGTATSGLVKSTIGLYDLLRDGIGDTLRISLTGDPVEEVIAAKTLLHTLGQAGIGRTGGRGGASGGEIGESRGEYGGIELISCPTCARCKTDIVSKINGIERKLHSIKTGKHIKVAVMGCAVNGPGEARGADVGVAGGDGKALIFKHGEPQYQVPESEIADALFKELMSIV
ncbi:MAG: (E)-4-hydroxy-3-methylbut-2-enyl-diphosphate synthase [Oscillospiraceae bacterium]|nr:(E)-4-hydroxy-3-methylbut-2-enyl-diphosphate synthase [Oscillospiraceae bacterium]